MVGDQRKKVRDMNPRIRILITMIQIGDTVSYLVFFRVNFTFFSFTFFPLTVLPFLFQQVYWPALNNVPNDGVERDVGADQDVGWALGRNGGISIKIKRHISVVGRGLPVPPEVEETFLPQGNQCCGSGMFIPETDFSPSRIPDPTKKRAREKLVGLPKDLSQLTQISIVNPKH